jgi:6-phosphogluconolactonase
MTLTRRSALSLLAAAPIALRAQAGAQPVSASKLYIGTYTDPVTDAVGTTPGAKGIYTCSWNAATGTLGPFELIAATPDPSFLTFSPRHPNMLYAVNELPDPKNGAVSAFAIIPGTPRLERRSFLTTGGSSPCHLAFDHTGRVLFAANYYGGSLASYKVNAQGRLEPVTVHRFSGHSIDPDRQTTAHTHCSLFSPDNRFLLVNDLGLDRIMVFHVDTATAKLTPASTPFYSATPGAGPRHTIFHPNGRWVYSTNELNSTIDRFDWTSADGLLAHKATVSSLPPAAQRRNSSLPPAARQIDNAPAELATDAEGKFLYVSNRFHDSIAVFTIDPQDGSLIFMQDIPCGGKTPRFFAIDPSGRWLLVANQDSRNIVVFECDHANGTLKATGASYLLDAPVCILFA